MNIIGVIDQLDAILRSVPDSGRAQLKLAGIRAKAQKLSEEHSGAQKAAEEWQRKFQELHQRTQQIPKALVTSRDETKSKQPKNGSPRGKRGA